jgi:hypothetical protein
MSLIVKSNDGQAGEPLPVGVQQAVCFKVIDLGIQDGFQGKPQHKLVILWELDERRKEGEFAGKRFLASKTYTASLGEKANLRHDLESWRSTPFTQEQLEGFDIEKVIGKPCLLNLVAIKTKAGKDWTVIQAIMPLVKGMTPLVAETNPDYVPPWIQKILGTEPKDPDAVEPPMPADDGIPF